MPDRYYLTVVSVHLVIYGSVSVNLFMIITKYHGSEILFGDEWE